MNDRNQRKLKLLQLRRLRFRSSFITSIEGDLAQKSNKRVGTVSQAIITKLKRDLASSNWKLVPRGKIAVKMSFFAKDSQVPVVHNLVKYYMDLLKGLFFEDDRQVHYLEAYCFRTKRDESECYVELERLATYQKKLHYYFEFKEQFGDDDWTSENLTELLKILNKAQRQRAVLELNRIEIFDKPGNHIEHFADFVRDYQAWHPYIIDLGDLPQRSGESKKYKQRIRDTLRTLTERSHIFNPIIVPVELDVQVTPHIVKLAKDLDNIMIDILRPFIEEVLGDGGYLNAFRIYVTDKLPGDITGGIRLKLLPFGAVEDFRRSVSKVLSKAEDYLDRQR
jgi:Holliday junction resolvase RusA-like endonuclease